MNKMLKLIVLVLLLVCQLQASFAQCAPAENCHEINCIFSKSELEAVTWNSGGFAADPAPFAGFCGTFQNDQWFAFIADNNQISVTIISSNCADGNGVQMGIYPDCDAAPIACHGGAAGGMNVPITVASNVVPGETYYLMVDGYSGDVCDFTISALGVSDHIRHIQGKVAWDINEDCLLDAGDQGGAGTVVHLDGVKSLTTASGADGSFHFYYTDSTEVVVSVDGLPGNYWTACDSSYTINPDSFPDTAQVNFMLQPNTSCAYMQVDLGLPPFFRACSAVTASVKYYNGGTVSADNVYIKVAIPQGITVDSTSIPITSQSGDTLRFDIGTVPPLASSEFFIYLKPQCDGSQLGQTKCLSAHIYPDSTCPAWMRAHIEVTARCVGDSTVEFVLRNTGLLPTSAGLEYIIIEDEVVLLQGTFFLAPHDSMIVQKPANGSTWRMQSQQEPGHPGFSQPAVSLEGCGGFASLGLVNAFPQDDADAFVDIECRTVVGSYDPNIKVASPAGVGSKHLITKNTPINYTLHFQNTGTDTAFRVRLLDTLPLALNAKTFRPGIYSHPCTWRFTSERTLEVIFDPIALPDSTTNERASHGWFEFSIEQQPDLPNGTYIENRAAIFFDYNAPVITDAAWHTVGKLVVSIHEPEAGKQNLWRVLGNPTQASCTFQAIVPTAGLSRFQLMDAQGRTVHTAEFSGQQYTFMRNNLAAGVYFFHIQTAQEGATSGKIMLQD